MVFTWIRQTQGREVLLVDSKQFASGTLEAGSAYLILLPAIPAAVCYFHVTLPNAPSLHQCLTRSIARSGASASTSALLMDGMQDFVAASACMPRVSMPTRWPGSN